MVNKSNIRLTRLIKEEISKILDEEKSKIQTLGINKPTLPAVGITLYLTDEYDYGSKEAKLELSVGTEGKITLVGSFDGEDTHQESIHILKDKIRKASIKYNNYLYSLYKQSGFEVRKDEPEEGESEHDNSGEPNKKIQKTVKPKFAVHNQPKSDFDTEK